MLRGMGLDIDSGSGSGGGSGGGSNCHTNWGLVGGIVCAGLYPNVARVAPAAAGGAGLRTFAQRNGGAAAGDSNVRQHQVYVHPSSVNHQLKGMAQQAAAQQSAQAQARSRGSQLGGGAAAAGYTPTGAGYPVPADDTVGWLAFREKVHTSRAFVRDTTLVSPHAMVLFGATSTSITVQVGSCGGLTLAYGSEQPPHMPPQTPHSPLAHSPSPRAHPAY
jgi:hypothetical protein